jgi:hypothetical protein
MTNEEFRHQFKMLALSSAKCPGTLEGLWHDDRDFAIQAGIRLAAALSSLRNDERRSLGQVLTQETEKQLLAWLAIATPAAQEHAPVHEHELSPRMLEGLTILAAFTSAARRAGTSDGGYWSTVREACGDISKAWFFNTQDAVRSSVLSRLGEVAIVLDLRRDFRRGDLWATLLALQAGFRTFDLPMLSFWVDVRRPALPIPILLAPGPNHSASMTCAWNAFTAYARRKTLRDTIESLACSCEWWPGWMSSEVCDVLDRRGSFDEPDGNHRAARTPMDGAAASDTSGADPFASHEDGEGPISDENSQRQPDPARAAIARDERPLGAVTAHLDLSGSRFCLVLPERLAVDPGPVTLTGDDFRVGGEVQIGGSVRWHTQGQEIAIKLRGAAERLIVLESGGGALEQRRLQLWEHNSYISAFSLLPGRGRPFDPYLFPFPKKGGVAVLLHQSLELSVRADKEHRLDGDHRLHVFHSGLPPQLSVSCEGEILWEAAKQEDTGRVLPDDELHLVLDGEGPRWGGDTQLCLRQAPNGFIPRRAVIGPQVLPFASGGPPWILPHFSLLPGMDVLRRRGRIDGSLNGERVAIPAVAFLGRAPVGAALRDDERWRPLEPDGPFLTGVDGGSRLWACLPDLGVEQEWTVFEGARVAAPYAAYGIRLEPSLLGLGERLSLEPRRFNLNGTGLPLAAMVLNTGVVRGAVCADAVARVSLAKQIGWTEKHRALAWHAGGVTELSFLESESRPDGPVFALPEHPVDGISLFFGSSGLGNAFLTPQPATILQDFLGNAEDWTSRLEFALAARLPILTSEAAEAVGARLSISGGAILNVLCRLPADPTNSHIVGNLLHGWEPHSRISEAIVGKFIKTLRENPTQTTVLDRVVAEAPCAAARIIALGTVPLPRAERPKILFALAARALPKDVSIMPSLSGRMDAAVEGELLDRAVQVARLDRNFLVARDVGLAAIAWENLSNPKPCQNLEIALSDAPVRRWLAVHLLSRLAASIC